MAPIFGRTYEMALPWKQAVPRWMNSRDSLNGNTPPKAFLTIAESACFPMEKD